MTVNESLERTLHGLGRRTDLMIVVLLVATIMLMILPLPTYLVDFLIAANIGLSVLLLMAGLYLRHPVDFSTLPAVILISTVFRLSLAITTTRLILVQADAGEIIRTFGEFVVAGNLIVGLVIFFIITIVQFVVITKGAERVAEVSARFMLDALPGKQMSIDSDIRNGDIDQQEARRRRKRLERESQLYGAMDGAMKFVKGDAIAGLVIIVVNLVGGLAVGTMQHGLPIGEALQVYALLTVGDGLVSQIPALFVAITAGTVVTRVADEDGQNLGSEITSQLIADPRSLRLAAVVLVFLSFVPGFPSAIFLLLAALFGGIGLIFYLRDRRRGTATGSAERSPAAQAAASEGARRLPRGEVTMLVAPELSGAIGPDGPRRGIARARRRLFDELGIEFPEVGIVVDDRSKGSRFRIDIEGVPVARGEIPAGKILLRDDPAHAELLGIERSRGEALPGLGETVWLDASHGRDLTESGVAFADATDVLAECLLDTLRRYAAQFVGIQETRALLARMESGYGDLVREAQRVVPLQKIADVLRRLLDEGIPVRHMRVLLEALVEWGQKEQDPVLLAEYVRSSLKRQICHKYADDLKVISAYIIERDAEDVIRTAVRQTSVGNYLALAGDAADRLVERVRTLLRASASNRATPVMLTSMDVRRFVRGLLMKNGIALPVLSYQELAPEFTVQPIGSVRIELPGDGPRAGSPARRQTATAIDKVAESIGRAALGAPAE